MTKNIRIGRISYINVDPIYYGLENGDAHYEYKIISKKPFILNKMLEDKELDISSVSSAAYAQNHDKWLILPNLSVSCFANVMSVIFVSKVPIKELHSAKVIISEESKTASDLIKVFFYSQNISPLFVRQKIESLKDIKEKAALIIGDAALAGGWNKHFKYVWDLGDLWKDMTKLPFVFALWAADKEFVSQNREAALKAASDICISKQKGEQNIKTIAAAGSKKLGISYLLCRRYFDKLNFNLDKDQIEGLTLFFDRLRQYNIVDKKVNLNFL